MRFAIDLHIHSTLSPCGDKDMTPNNIINMAYVKGLDIISVTDHNSMLNLQSVIRVGRERGILVVPGIEVTTREEVHVLCYFENLYDGIKFQDKVLDSLPHINNKKSIFGNQYIMDHRDNILGEVDRLLVNSSTYTIDEINLMVTEHNGAMIPAHAFRKSNGIFSTLGFIPDNLKIRTMEVSKNYYRESLEKRNNIGNLKIIVGSDAHYLGDISEPNVYIDIESLSIESVISYLREE